MPMAGFFLEVLSEKGGVPNSLKWMLNASIHVILDIILSIFLSMFL